MPQANTTSKIAALNDRFRETFWGGKVMTTQGINLLPEATQLGIFRAVMEFDQFSQANDPYGEHDFGKITVDGHNCFWKIDYYDNRMEFGSENPANPDVTTRVLTVMLTDEY